MLLALKRVELLGHGFDVKRSPHERSHLPPERPRSKTIVPGAGSVIGRQPQLGGRWPRLTRGPMRPERSHMGLREPSLVAVLGKLLEHPRKQRLNPLPHTVRSCAIHPFESGQLGIQGVSGSCSPTDKARPRQRGRPPRSAPRPAPRQSALGADRPPARSRALVPAGSAPQRCRSGPVLVGPPRTDAPPHAGRAPARPPAPARRCSARPAPNGTRRSRRTREAPWRVPPTTGRTAREAPPGFAFGNPS